MLAALTLTPVATSAGNVINVPPPASALTPPPASAATPTRT
jgi:Tfp pilus assembly protein FimV